MGHGLAHLLQASVKMDAPKKSCWTTTEPKERESESVRETEGKCVVRFCGCLFVCWFACWLAYACVLVCLFACELMEPSYCFELPRVELESTHRRARCSEASSYILQVLDKHRSYLETSDRRDSSKP